MRIANSCRNLLQLDMQNITNYSIMKLRSATMNDRFDSNENFIKEICNLHF